MYSTVNVNCIFCALCCEFGIKFFGCHLCFMEIQIIQFGEILFKTVTGFFSSSLEQVVVGSGSPGLCL